MFKCLDRINDKSEDLALSLNQYCLAYSSFFKKSLATDFKNAYGLPESTIINVEVKTSGVNEGFIISLDQRKFYVKESLSYRQEKKINPKELLIYKLMEITKLGPKTKFILKKFLTSKTGANVCYISTQDVSFSKDPNKRKTFVTDNLSNTEGLEQWEMALNDDEFLTSFLTFSIVDDLLFLSDTLRSNVDNYGCLKIHNIGTNNIKFKIKVIDHLPD